MTPLKLGKKGYYGSYTSIEKNIKVVEMNKLIDEYNSSINSFATRKDQIIFDNNISYKIEQIRKSI